MRRREFITLIGGVAAAWPLTARAQQAKVPTIGFLGTATASLWRSSYDAFVQRLRELGWIEGRTVAIEYRWGEGRSERFAEIAAEFVRLKVDVIVTAGSAVPAIKQATSVIVFAVAVDPLGGGLVASLARPGGNAPACMIREPTLPASGRESLRDAVLPFTGWRSWRWLSRSRAGDGEVQATARALGLTAALLEMQQAEDIGSAVESLKGHADALYVCTDGLVNANRVRINTLALAARLPTMHAHREYIRNRRSDVLWTKLPRPAPARRRLVDKFCAARSRPTSGSSSPRNLISSSIYRRGESARLDHFAPAARPRRRGDRIRGCVVRYFPQPLLAPSVGPRWAGIFPGAEGAANSSWILLRREYPSLPFDDRFCCNAQCVLTRTVW